MKKRLREIADFTFLNDVNHFNYGDIIIPGIAPTKNLVILYTDDYHEPFLQSFNIVIRSKVLSQNDLFLHLDTKEFKNYIKTCTMDSKKVNIKRLGEFEIEIPSLKVKKYYNFENIFFLDNLSFSEIKTVYKYIPLKRFLRMIDDKKITFVSPETWYDPFETRFYLADYSKYDFKKPNVYCMCLTNKGYENEEASWKMYSDENNSKTVKIAFDTTKLLNYLNAYAASNKSKIFIGKAIYNYTVKEIKNLHMTGAKGNNYFFPDKFNTENFINLLCIKRHAFIFENEIRIFIVDNKNKQESYFKFIQKIDFQSGLIKSIRLSPYPPFSYDDPRKKIYKKLQSIESEAIKAQIENKLPNIKIIQSQLYIPSSKKVKL